MKLDIRSMCLCSMFSILIAVGAFIKIPISIVPITMQTLFVVLAGFVLGKKNAAISVLLYIVIGLIGLPIFANGGGIAYVLQPSFGYLLGFVVGAWLVGILSEKTNQMSKLMLSAIIGMVVIYIIGIIYFAFIQHVYYGVDFTLEWLFYYLFIVYLPGDTISCILASWIAHRLKEMNIITNYK